MFLCAGYSPILAIRLVQEYHIPLSVATGLVHRYGGRARYINIYFIIGSCTLYIIYTRFLFYTHPIYYICRDILEIAVEVQDSTGTGSEAQKQFTHPSNRKLTDLRVLIPEYNYIEAEIVYAVHYEWAVHAEDFLGKWGVHVCICGWWISTLSVCLKLFLHVLYYICIM